MYVLYIYNIIYLYMDNIYIIYTYYLQVHLHHLPWADGAQAGKPERTKRNEDAKWLQQEEQNHAESKVATVAYCSPLPSLPIITVMLSISCCQLLSAAVVYGSILQLWSNNETDMTAEFLNDVQPHINQLVQHWNASAGSRTFEHRRLWPVIVWPWCFTQATSAGQCQEHAEDAEALLGCIWRWDTGVFMHISIFHVLEVLSDHITVRHAR